MTTLVINGIGDAPGKTAIAAGLARHWKNAGRSVGYLGPGADFISKTLGVGETGDIVIADGGPGDGPALTVVGYEQGLTLPETPANGVGMVVNCVPEKSLDRVRELMNGALAVLPESRTLMGFTIGEMARHLGTEYLVAPQGDGALIEHLMIGANITDTATSYFMPKGPLAVFCRCDRPDLQLAALNQGAVCLVLVSVGLVQASVVHRAEGMGIPVLRTTDEALDVLARLDGLVEGQRFRQEAKVPAIAALMDRHFDFGALDRALGL